MDKESWESLMIQLIQRIFNMLISINTLKTATKTTQALTANQCPATMAAVSEVDTTTKTKVVVEWTTEDITTISEVVEVALIEVVEEVDTTTTEEAEEATTNKEVDLTTIFPMGIQVKTTKLSNASSLNLLVNANLVTNALLHMVKIS